MDYFVYSSATGWPSHLSIDIKSKPRMLLLRENKENPSFSAGLFGYVLETRVNSHRGAWSVPFIEVSLKLGNGWIQLAPGDEVFLYHPEGLTEPERKQIATSIGFLMLGNPMVSQEDLDATLNSIREAWGDGEVR